MQAPNSGRRVLTEEVILQKTRVSSLSDVRHLNLWGEQLEDVSIIMQLRRVEVVALVANRISELKPFAACAHLQELYLRKNRIDSLVELNALRGLAHLHTMWLMDNPCAAKPHYREFAIFCCPHLQHLDDIPVTLAEREAATEKMTPSFVEALLAKEPRGGTPRVATPSGVLAGGTPRIRTPLSGPGAAVATRQSPDSAGQKSPTPSSRPHSPASASGAAAVKKPLPLPLSAGENRDKDNNKSPPVSAGGAKQHRPPSPAGEKPVRTSPRPAGQASSSPSATSAPPPAPAAARTKAPSEARSSESSPLASPPLAVPQEALLSSIRSLLPLLTPASKQQLMEELQQHQPQKPGDRKINLTPIERVRERKKQP